MTHAFLFFHSNIDRWRNRCPFVFDIKAGTAGDDPGCGRGTFLPVGLRLA